MLTKKSCKSSNNICINVFFIICVPYLVKNEMIMKSQ